jgi:hypothetical protein
MRYLLSSAELCTLAYGAAAAEGSEHHKKSVSATPSTTMQAAAINTIDPITGTAVDKQIDPVAMNGTIDGKSVSVRIATANPQSAATLKSASDADAIRYIKAAQSNSMVKDGKIVPAPKM